MRKVSEAARSQAAHFCPIPSSDIVLSKIAHRWADSYVVRFYLNVIQDYDLDMLFLRLHTRQNLNLVVRCILANHLHSKTARM